MEQLEQSAPPDSPNETYGAAVPLNTSGKKRRRRIRQFSAIRKFFSRSVRWRVIGIGLIVVITVLVGSQVVLLTDAANQLQNSQRNFERVFGRLSPSPVRNSHSQTLTVWIPASPTYR